ncbi:hypothetical protein OSIRIS_70 [Brevibacillus phage Osiris]|uniref:Uncharacterized protein n=3 Tax=Caudoviricetes TaxID=2731619 RepID=S5MUT0_9CAUD|nr:hypothetical protein DAVIES_62 [Brevibacillus phage Davies]YP_009215084.1 hypothetical protein AVV10_gp070 [Brevibacillus phage Osiris]AGR47587.1 hypothetical protein DAVIES_62 [Brevibacillus phage Davies]ALA07333.1 hypothetical protein OSIRIS_70 [Brevibacillus phage Osiris]ALA48080.1 hypothetical protein POWDER_70 [Brevibacillus phage Powder]
MSIETAERKLLFYQRMMVIAKTDGDNIAYEIYRQITREIEKTIREHEKTACSQQTAS